MTTARRSTGSGGIGLIFVVLTVSGQGCGGNGSDEPKFVRTPTCPFGMAGDHVEGGVVVVPAFHEGGEGLDGPILHLAVAVVEGPNRNTFPDAVVVLAGGPGGGAVDSAARLAQEQTSLFGGRDVVFIDQRGTGHSLPRLGCTFTETAPPNRAALLPGQDAHELTASDRAELVQCHAKLSAELNHSLSAYRTVENADDIDWVRRALRYRQWNLLGGSYGTRLALEVMRRHSGGVRSAVIDSVLPPQVDLLATAGPLWAAAFEGLFTRCAASADCMPDLRDRFFAAIDALDANPVEIQQGALHKIGGRELVAALQHSLYRPFGHSVAPLIIAAAAAGQLNSVAEFIDVSNNLDSISLPMYFSVLCADEAPFTDRGKFDAAFAGLEDWRRLLFDVSFISVCANWPVTPADPTANTAVVSDVPTLVASGTLDPVTPPAWGQLAQASLSRSYHIEVSNAAHGAIDGECAVGIMEQFLNAPDVTPDTRCTTNLEPLRFYRGPSAAQIPEHVPSFDLRQLMIVEKTHGTFLR